jgi:hypothetical protein
MAPEPWPTLHHVLQFGEVVKGIGVVQFAGMNEAHEQVAHFSTVLGLIKQTILPTTENFS